MKTIRYNLWLLKEAICNYIKKYCVFFYLKKYHDKDIEKIRKYIKKHGLVTFPYDFVSKYEIEMLSDKIIYDSHYNQYYVRYKNKKLYLKKKWNKKECEAYFLSLLIEQDRLSPHCYANMKYKISSKDVIIDAGGAEGIFCADALYEGAREVYIFECDQEWCECLKKSFGGDARVHIVERFISNDDCKLDEMFKDKKYTFIKADIEGYEIELLNGAKNTIRRYNPAMVLCCYHKHADALRIKDILDSYNIPNRYSAGYMLYEQWDYGKFKKPYLRKGLIYGNENSFYNFYSERN